MRFREARGIGVLAVLFFIYDEYGIHMCSKSIYLFLSFSLVCLVSYEYLSIIKKIPIKNNLEQIVRT